MHGTTDTAGNTSPPRPTTTQRPPVILQVLPALDTGGVERGTVDVAQGLTESGWTALVASQGGRLEHDLNRVGARHLTLPLATKNPLALRRNAHRLRVLIQELGVDLIHARSRAPAWSALWAARAAGIPLVTTFHGTYGRGPIGVKTPYNRVMCLGDRVIAISWFIAEHIRTHYGLDPETIRVVPRGVDLNSFAPDVVSSHRIARLATEWRLPEDAKVVLLPGRQTRWKGQSLLIEAMARLRRSDVRCLLVGADQGRTGYREELETLVRRHGLQAHIHILDHCDDMPAAYRLARVVVSASLEPEAFGRIPAEAQAMGRIVLAPRHGGAQEIIEDGVTGWLFEPGNPISLADHLAMALDLDDATYDSLAWRGMMRTRQTFSKDTMIKRTLSVYKELLYGAPPLETLWRGYD